ncbi:DUF1631 domain-containing protein [Xylella fastidiosa subsp. morus]|uniref:DUF1631 family protein n=1 Tax=Xylella fastidiosa TaxID=2371 RepID=UPI0003ECF124|nr:DUF1631 family protein [Xylella fastidiosa]AIC13660.1 hypothetical protein P303_04175 [Xylella fastidiosa MUL0034]EWG14228.1 hypothetical protein P910_002433 [Xylella fastidiosa Mul-MD]UIN27657.1 DUF1631 domain-containing protein [Xylella fastidiosa subsp. morus]UIT35816.1 DUF1631 domain-containing protein [Xylella fastidiosa subsp. morus]UIT38108.1 DUF1631 domain-containing protein [Xylella fastidiosa subsp. morus]
MRKTPPVRCLLNALTDACDTNVGSTLVDLALMGKVEEIVKRLMSDFKHNFSIFLSLEQAFLEFLMQHRCQVGIVERRIAETQRRISLLERNCTNI